MPSFYKLIFMKGCQDNVSITDFTLDLAEHFNSNHKPTLMTVKKGNNPYQDYEFVYNGSTV